MANNGKAKLSDLTPDDRNANKGTQRGTGVIEDSLRKYGAGRSILIDRNGRIISGNKTAEAAASIGLENVRIIETDGHEIVAVKRTDLDLDSKEARELAIADNRAGELNLDWDVDALTALEAEGVDLDGLFSDEEMSRLMQRLPGEDELAGAFGSLPDSDKPGFQQMTFTLSNDQVATVRAAMSAARDMGPFIDTGNENGNGNALARICEAFLGGG